MQNLEKEIQVPLDVFAGTSREDTLETFIVSDCNRVAYNCIEGLLSSDFLKSWNFIYLYASSGYGKTHLLKAIANKAHAMNVESVYLNLEDWLDFDPFDFLTSVENYPIICLDNVDIVAKNSDWESELFNLYNRWISKEKGIFITSSSHAQLDCGFVKKEFVTRLQSGITLSLKEPTLEFIEDVLIDRENVRGGLLPRNLAHEIAKKLKSLPECLKALDLIDNLSLEYKKGINRRIVNSILSEFKVQSK